MSALACRFLVHGLLSKLRRGELTLHENGKSWRFGVAEPDRPLRSRVTVHDPRVYGALISRGTIGAAESFLERHWSSDDLVTFVRTLVRDREVLEGMEKGVARFVMPFFKLGQVVRANTRTGSKTNIAAHYDLGNALFALFLDPTLTYSSAWFDREDRTLEAAQLAKLERVCSELGIGRDDHVLEIGTGWGSFAIHAAKTRGCRVTTTTISQAQHDEALARVRAAGLADRVTLLQKDYRDLEGRFDKVVSIEMIEAVGHRFLPTYLRKCAALLSPRGKMLLQAITIQDQHYETALRRADFIQTHIFPGSFIPSVTAIVDTCTRHTDLRAEGVFDLGNSYARTLQIWRERFLEQVPAVRALGYDDRFCLAWEYYLAYCEGGFRERFLSCNQILLRKPEAE